MNIGIYIPGLGQSFQQESVEKYASRILNEIRYRTQGGSFVLKSEKTEYAPEKECTVVSIIDESKSTTPLYKIYEFKYCDILTSKFKTRNILSKNASLLGLVLKKLPIVMLRLFRKGSYNSPFQTFYIFLMFLLIALAILFTVPAVFEIVTHAFNLPQIKDTFHIQVNEKKINDFTQVFVSAIAILLILAPQSRTLATELASEFLCINNYLEFGWQNQEIHGNLDLLVEYISEKEDQPCIHYHAYSFGTIIALDHLFPYGNIPSANSQKNSKALITIATPFEFVKTYYPSYYNNRSKILANKITWLNVYSIADALATNFRKDDKADEAQYGLPDFETKPFNINYEVSQLNKYSLANFISLYSLKVHNMYWDSAAESQSCLRLVYTEMIDKQLMDDGSLSPIKNIA